MSKTSALAVLLLGTTLAQAHGGFHHDSFVFSSSSSSSSAAPSLANLIHYGNPATGCMLDELAISIQGVPGGVCSASCKSQPCPQDRPEGCEAQPRCALENRATGDKFCALLCNKGVSCGPGASCKMVQAGVGICTYDVNRKHHLRKHKHEESDSDDSDSDDDNE